jgi:ribosomal protein S17E
LQYKKNAFYKAYLHGFCNRLVQLIFIQMTKKILVIIAAIIALQNGKAQNLQSLLGKKSNTNTDTSKPTNTLQQAKNLLGKSNASSSNISDGLKEALTVGAERTVAQLSKTDGFLGNQAIKILFPPEAQVIEQKLRAIGMGKQVDDAIVSLNRAAEDAAKSATPIFVNAIKNITLQDAMGILRGNDTAATSYLKGNTLQPISNAFKPVITQSLDKVNATQHWATIVNAYNRISFKKVNPDLAGYVTEKATDGLFKQIGEEEKKIRQNPAARSTQLLQQVFGK